MVEDELPVDRFALDEDVLEGIKEIKPKECYEVIVIES
jgi:hypothetical protein